VNAQSSTNTTVTEQQVSKKYTCPMHPEIVMDKPGNCPKCGMTLVEKTNTKQGGMHKMHDMKNINNMQDTTKMKCDSTKMKKCCMNNKSSCM
jgi:transcription initiation factor IIE alpha subunit